MSITARKPPSGGGSRQTNEAAKDLELLKEASTDTAHDLHEDLVETDGWAAIAEYDEGEERTAYSRASSLRKSFDEDGFEFRGAKEDSGAAVYARFIGTGSLFV